jgi:hypothetical protein
MVHSTTMKVTADRKAEDAADEIDRGSGRDPHVVGDAVFGFCGRRDQVELIVGDLCQRSRVRR